MIYNFLSGLKIKTDAREMFVMDKIISYIVLVAPQSNEVRGL